MQLCLKSESNLAVYRQMLKSAGLVNHDNPDKLRDVEDIYTNNNHVFSYNHEMLGSFDICGNCEAHALLFGIENGLASSIQNSTSLFQLDYEKYRKNNTRFHNCPVK